MAAVKLIPFYCIRFIMSIPILDSSHAIYPLKGKKIERIASLRVDLLRSQVQGRTPARASRIEMSPPEAIKTWRGLTFSTGRVPLSLGSGVWRMTVIHIIIFTKSMDLYNGRDRSQMAAQLGIAVLPLPGKVQYPLHIPHLPCSTTNSKTLDSAYTQTTPMCSLQRSDRGICKEMVQPR